MKKRKMTTGILGRLCRGIKYSDIGHFKGATIFWFYKNRIKTHISQGTLKDFHCHVMRKIDNIESDITWRGRSSQKKSGIVTLLPPVEIYASDNYSIPGKILGAIKKKFTPTRILVDTKKGLRFLEQSRISGKV